MMIVKHETTKSSAPREYIHMMLNNNMFYLLCTTISALYYFGKFYAACIGLTTILAIKTVQYIQTTCSPTFTMCKTSIEKNIYFETNQFKVP